MKNSKKIITILFVILIFAAASFLAFKNLKPNSSKEKAGDTAERKITEYYVPLANFFSEKDNVAISDLEKYKNEGKLYFETGEKESLIGILGEGYRDVFEKDIKGLDLKEDEVLIAKWNAAGSKYKTLKYDNVLLWDKKKIGEYGLKTEKQVSADEEAFSPEKITTLKAGGDVIMSRHVATKMKSLGLMSPWQNVSGYLADADITFVDLEAPLSDRYPVPATGMSFISPVSFIKGVIESGIDIVSVANNHSANFGTEVFMDNLNTLKTSSISYCGGGENETDARTLKIVERNGLKFGFLCYNSIIGGVYAGSGPGMNPIYIEPWYRDDEKTIKQMEDDIKKARGAADVVIVSPHWGVEYNLNQNESQTKVARRAIAAGADLVLGTHPHVVQGIENYNEKFIAYSLGNLIFDQEWSTETKQGTVIETYFYGNKMVSGKLVPYQIEDYNRPYFAKEVIKKDILSRIKSASIGF